MRPSRETIKKGVMGVVSVIFVLTAYLTFFREKPSLVAPPVTAIVQVPSQPAALTPGVTGGALQGAAPKPLTFQVLEDSPPILFHPEIRDIFQKPQAAEPPSPEKTALLAPPAPPEPAMTEAEKQALKDALKFQGAILHDRGAVAIINNTFFHVGDTINGHRIFAISENEVRIDTTGGTLILEILHYE